MIRDFIRRTVFPHIEAERNSRLRAEDTIYRTMESHRKHGLEEIDILAAEIRDLRRVMRASGKARKLNHKK